MPSKKKSKMRSSLKSAKKIRRGSKGKISRRSVSNRIQKRVSTPKCGSHKKAVLVSAGKELKREVQNRNLTGRTAASLSNREISKVYHGRSWQIPRVLMNWSQKELV